MSLWDTIKGGVKSAWRGVKNFFSGDTYSDTVKDDTNQDTGKETLNQQIANGNINKNTTTTTTMPSGLDTLNLTPEQTPEAKQEYVSPVKQADQEEEGFLDKISNFFSGAASDIVDAGESVNNWMRDVLNSRKAKAEYNNQEEMYAIGYNPDNRNMYYLDLNEDRGLFDWDLGTYDGTQKEFDELLNNAIMQQNLPGLTQEQKDQAFMDFYNNAKSLFRIRADDRYTDGLFGKTTYGRRDEMYTQDELNMLATSGKTSKGKYEPTPGEFQDFVDMYLRNRQKQNELGIKYGSTDKDAEVFEIGGEAQSNWMQGFEDEALKGIEDYFEPMEIVNPDAASNAKLTYKSTVVDGLGGRVYTHFAPLFRAEAEIMGRDPETWSWQDKYLLGQAETARQMSKVIAQNINEVMRQTLLYGTNKQGDIVNTPDRFENGESLNDVMTRGLRELAGLDEHRYSEHESYIDIAEKFANNAMYIYKQDKAGPLAKAWNDIEYFFKPVGTTLGEAGQATMALGMDIVGGISMGTLYDGLTKSYMDQDATAFRLLETDDSNLKRTVKKYYLDAVEYAPEVMGNLIPDIALYALTGPGALTTTVRHLGDISRTYKVVKAAEGASMLNKLGVLLRGVRGEKSLQKLGLTFGKYSEIINATKAAPKIKNFQQWKTGAQLLDRAVTQVGLGQFMDAQWSAYDTEPYSQSSFLMSLIGSVTFDALPEVTRLITGRGWWNLLTGKYGDSIWSLARYIDSSDEAAENIARALRKGTGEIGVDDLKTFVRKYGAIEEAAKKAYNSLTPEQQAQIGKMTKGMMYSYVNQAFGANSTIGKRVRQILANDKTNVADVIKYLGNIPGDVSVGPFVSTIRLKNGTRANIFAKGKMGEYDPVLDSVFNGGLDSRVRKGFSQSDIDAISDLDKYKNIEKNKKKYFYEVTDEKGNTTYYLTNEGLNYFGLRPESITLESLGITLKDAENTREALKKIKGVESVKISDKAIDDLAETGAYDEITSKVKELLGC